MALINLVATSAMELSFGIEKKSFSYYELPFDNCVLSLPRIGDVFNPRTVQFKNVSSDFHFNSLSLEIGGTLILTIDSEIGKLVSSDFEEEFLIDNQRVINYNIPWNEMRLDNLLKLVALQYHDVKFRINYQGNFSQASMLGICTFLDSEPRIQMAQSAHEQIIEQLSKQNIQHNELTTEHTILFNGISKGLFFNNINLNDIIKLEIQLNEETFIDLDLFSIRTFIKVIDQDNFYLPFDGIKDFNNTDYSGGVNFSKIDSTILKLETLHTCNFNIGCKNLNHLRIMSGMGGLSYFLSNEQHVFMRENKLLQGENECPVNYNIIKSGDEYLNCGVCKKNFGLPIVQEWVEKRKSCPMCRQKWKIWKIFKNI